MIGDKVFQGDIQRGSVVGSIAQKFGFCENEYVWVVSLDKGRENVSGGREGGQPSNVPSQYA